MSDDVYTVEVVGLFPALLVIVASLSARRFPFCTTLSLLRRRRR
jgi:hypothetical protein